MNVSIVWIDENIAKIYHFSDDRMERALVRVSPDPVQFCDEIRGHLKDSRQILILSPNLAGQELSDALEVRDPRIGSRIIGCEKLLDPDDIAIANYATRYFRKPIRTGTA